MRSATMEAVPNPRYLSNLDYRLVGIERAPAAARNGENSRSNRLGYDSVSYANLRPPRLQIWSRFTFCGRCTRLVPVSSTFSPGRFSGVLSVCSYARGLVRPNRSRIVCGRRLDASRWLHWPAITRKWFRPTLPATFRQARKSSRRKPDCSGAL